MKNIILPLVILTIAIPAFSQIKQLPYSNSFSNATERNELTVVRKGVASSSTWNLGNSTILYASHDYPVGGSSTDTVSDWLFTPPIKIVNGTILSFKYYVYGITGSATADDEFSVWYGKNSKDPDNGTYVKIADLTNKISTSTAWKDTSGINLPFASDTGYVVFRYRATNNWFTLGLDSIVIKETLTGVIPIEYISNEDKFYPNPSTGIINFIYGVDVLQTEVMSINSRLLGTFDANDINNGSLDLSSVGPGVYILRIITTTGTLYRKLVLE